jgi:CheY-like chemotaxis protein
LGGTFFPTGPVCFSTRSSDANVEVSKIDMPNRVPGTDGVKLIKFIRALEHLVTAAVVMVTGNHEVTEQAKAADDDQVLLKSVTPNALACAVDRHVSSVRGGA